MTKKQRFWQKPSFWQKVEKWKPYVKAGISALKVANMLLAPNPVSYAVMAQEIIKTTIAAGNPPAEPTEIIEFLADLVIHKLAQEEVGTAIELFLETPVYISDWRPDKPKCSLAVGGSLCEGIFISSLQRSLLLDGLSFEERDKALWKIINEEQAKLDEIDRLAEEKAAQEEADRIYFEEKEAIEQANQRLNEQKDDTVEQEDLKQTSEDIMSQLPCCSKDSVESEVLTHLLVDSCYMAFSN